MSTEGAPAGPTRSLMTTGLGVVLMVTAAIWLIEVIDSVFLNDAWQRQGIWPRRWSGLDGVLWAPFLHVDFPHLLSNTVPFVVLSSLIVFTRGLRTWAVVSAVVAIVGGLATWLLARSSVHVGASILIFGYITYLLVAGFVERSLKGILAGVVVGLLYGWTLVLGVLPVKAGVSWEGHLFGAMAGVLAALMLGERARTGSATG